MQIVEAGAHGAVWPGTSLAGCRTAPASCSTRRNTGLSSRPKRRRDWQEQPAGRVRREGPLGGRPSELAGRVRGVVFSNELLDAMPVHRLGWDAEAGELVRVGGGSFRQERLRYGPKC